ncbi:hypothetical protein HFP05_14235 [Rhodanobacter denitrificans]|nr:hypothetical protein [Rhodanobacter denitrificans]
MTAHRWRPAIDPVPSTRGDADRLPADVRRVMADDRRRRGKHALKEIVT